MESSQRIGRFIIGRFHRLEFDENEKNLDMFLVVYRDFIYDSFLSVVYWKGRRIPTPLDSLFSRWKHSKDNKLILRSILSTPLH